MAVRVYCPFNGKLCIHPDWNDCQYEYDHMDPRLEELWIRNEEYKMGSDCSWLPNGISRTEMFKALAEGLDYRKKRKSDFFSRPRRRRR